MFKDWTFTNSGSNWSGSIITSDSAGNHHIQISHTSAGSASDYGEYYFTFTPTVSGHHYLSCYYYYTDGLGGSGYVGYAVYRDTTEVLSGSHSTTGGDYRNVYADLGDLTASTGYTIRLRLRLLLGVSNHAFSSVFNYVYITNIPH